MIIKYQKNKKVKKIKIMINNYSLINILMKIIKINQFYLIILIEVTKINKKIIFNKIIISNKIKIKII